MSDKSFMIESLKSVADAYNAEQKKYLGALVERREVELYGRYASKFSYQELGRIIEDAYNNMMDLRGLGYSLQETFEDEVWFEGSDDYHRAKVYDPDAERYYR